jgi:hypothetical protein
MTTATLGSMLREGARALRRYTGLALVLYLLQLALAVVGGFVIARVLAALFADNLLFDQAIDGDAAALIALLQAQAALLPALVWIALTAVAAYAVVSWFLVGGLLAVLIERPRDRPTTVGTFGAGGALTFFSYARLALWCVVPYLAIGFLALVGLAIAGDTIEGAVTGAAFLGALGAALAPALVLLLLQYTVVDYARIELSRHPGTAAWRAFLRGYRLVFTRWRPLAHALLYLLAFAAVSAILVAITWDRPMLGASGAISLLVIRQVAAMVRFAAKIVYVGGQVELVDQLSRSARRG